MPTKNQLQALADEIAENLDPHVSEDVKLVQTGMALFRQGAVSHIKADETDLVTANVQDEKPAKVELDLMFSGMSWCSCQEDGLCRHLLATFFTLYAKVDSVAEWIENWREPVRPQEPLPKLNIRRASDLLKANGALKPDYSRWVQAITESFDAIMKAKTYTHPYIVVELFQIHLRRLKAGTPVETTWRLVYELVANVISFIKLARFSEEMGHSEDMVERTYIHLYDNLTDEVDDLLTKIDQHTLPFDFEPFIEKFPEDVFGLLTCADGLSSERIDLYQMLWTDFFKKNAWREAELERIETRLTQVQTGKNMLPLIVAEIHLNLLLGENERAFKRIESLDDDVIVPFILYWVKGYTLTKDWQRVGKLIDVLLTKVKGYLAWLIGDQGYQACAQFTIHALKAILHYRHQTEGKAELYERALNQMLPYSFYDYEHILFNNGHFEKWADLYALIGISYADIPKDRLKIIEKQQPEVLLAMMHQSIQSEIDLKNRQSYRIAVRHLKKLRTLYKKLKRMDDWQFFFDILLEKTKRLRAFHEECKRSRLIDA